MPKRKAKDSGDEEPRRSTRKRSAVKDAGLPDQTEASKPAPGSKSQSKSSKSKTGSHAKKKGAPITKGNENENENENEKTDDLNLPKPVKEKPTKTKAAPAKTVSSDGEPAPAGRQYWLLKAEPETRLENGHDISFSIDDLAAKTTPEPWDGIRNYGARNNLRAMKKGDLAFFYHSSCKVPGIVGIMEIVQEHSPDLSAHDSTKPYYDASSKPEDPKWSVVHVELRRKLKEPVTLKELKEWQKEEGHPLKDMQMLRMGRMSVSKVSVKEWEFLTGVMKERGENVTL